MDIRKIRKNLGLRQSDLATLLSIRLDEVKAGESGRRPFPPNAMGILASMADFLEGNIQTQWVPPSHPNELEKRRRLYTKEKARLEWELEALLVKSKAMNRLLDFAQHWTAFSPDPISENQRLLLEALRLKAGIWLEGEGPKQEIYLRCRLAEVLAGLLVLEEWGK